MSFLIEATRRGGTDIIRPLPLLRVHRNTTLLPLEKSYGIMFDREGNLYACNRGNSTIEKFSPTGADLGVFAHTGGGLHFMAMFRPRHLHIENETLESAGKVSSLQDSK